MAIAYCSRLTSPHQIMAAKKKRRPAQFDIQQAFAAHVAASHKAHAWAEKSLALRQVGKAAQAKTAENKAKSWLRKMMILEAQAGRGKPQGGRTAPP
jgi:hypothetical protein